VCVGGGVSQNNRAKQLHYLLTDTKQRYVSCSTESNLEFRTLVSKSTGSAVANY
jgi:hypothetical protein